MSGFSSSQSSLKRKNPERPEPEHTNPKRTKTQQTHSLQTHSLQTHSLQNDTIQEHTKKTQQEPERPRNTEQEHLNTEQQEPEQTNTEQEEPEQTNTEQEEPEQTNTEQEEPEQTKRGVHDIQTTHEKRDEHAKVTARGHESYLTSHLSKLKKLRESMDIVVEGSPNNFKLFTSFEETGFQPNLLKSTNKFQKPTPIQSQCWPIILSKRDVVGIAQTGSGKTLAFSLPGISNLVSDPSRKKIPKILILSPTRELALQIEQTLKPICSTCNIVVHCFYGGVPKGPQLSALRSGVDVVVATPGRLLDLMSDKACKLGSVNYLVLDEADRMLDMGFEKDIRQIISQIPKQRQTAMFSATWPTEIKQFASTFLNDPMKVTIGKFSGEGRTTNANVTQIVEVVEGKDRNKRLQELLQEYYDKTRKNRILIFVLYKKEAPFLESLLQDRGWNATSIHGNKGQKQRIEALEAFKSGSKPLLVATDVAARGLDIPHVEYVINYSFPLTVEDYVHRIGRTGRAGNKGIAHTFFQQCDKDNAGELVAFLKESNQPVPQSICKWGLAIKKKEPKLGKIDLQQKNTNHLTFSDSDDE